MLSKQEALFLRFSSVYQWRYRINIMGIILVSVLATGLIAQLLILLRPTWCPTLLCPAPQPLLQKDSIHDRNLEVSFLTLQSSLYMIPDNPSRYTLNNLPKNISVQLIGKNTAHPYRVVLGIHSLQQGRFGLIIEQVALAIRQIHLIPYPLRTWLEEGGRDFRSNPYQVIYRGESVGTQLPATYIPFPIGRIQLVPGESDELDIQVLSYIVADIHFQMQITYRVVNESQKHDLILPNIFEVIFSDISNWHLYRLQAGHLVPSP